MLLSPDPWHREGGSPEADQHVVQLYTDQAHLWRGVADWLSPPLREDGGALLLGTPENLDAIQQALRARGVDVDHLRRSARLVLLDARNFTARAASADGLPSVVETIRQACHALKARVGEGDVRAWGELVDLLVKEGHHAAAWRLEEAWNGIIGAERLRLLCSYQRDVFAPETQEALFHSVCETHARLIPHDEQALLEAAVDRALVDVFGSPREARTVANLSLFRAPAAVRMPPAQAILAGLHDIQPVLCRQVLERARFHAHLLRGG